MVAIDSWRDVETEPPKYSLGKQFGDSKVGIIIFFTESTKRAVIQSITCEPGREGALLEQFRALVGWATVNHMHIRLNPKGLEHMPWWRSYVWLGLGHLGFSHELDPESENHDAIRWNPKEEKDET